MTELESLFGAIGLALNMAVLPLLQQLVKQLTGWSDKPMLWTSVLSTYLLVDLLYIADMFRNTPNPDVAGIIYIVLGMIIYPLLVWYGTQGVYKSHQSTIVSNPILI